MPYCAAHSREAHLFGRYDKVSTIGLFIIAAVLLIIIELTVGSIMRTMGAVIWWCFTVLVMILLAVGGVGMHAVGRKVLQRRYPAIVSHYYTGSLGVKTATRVVRQPAPDSGLILAVTFTFSNDDFAARVAALHGTEAGPVQIL